MAKEQAGFGLKGDPAALAAQGILQAKIQLEKEGRPPRLVLVDDPTFEALENGWLESVRDLPWGDALAHEIEVRRKRTGKMFLGDGSIFGLWVVRVGTLEGFKVY